jgi:hypothetical protein
MIDFLTNTLKTIPKLIPDLFNKDLNKPLDIFFSSEKEKMNNFINFIQE